MIRELLRNFQMASDRGPTTRADYEIIKNESAERYRINFRGELWHSFYHDYSDGSPWEFKTKQAAEQFIEQDIRERSIASAKWITAR